MGIGSLFLNLLCCRSASTFRFSPELFLIGFNKRPDNNDKNSFRLRGGVGIGSLFLNLLPCISVSTCRLLPTLPACCSPGYLLQQKHSCSRFCCCILHFSHAPPAALHCSCSFACVLCANAACSSTYLCKVRLCKSVLVKLIINIPDSACSSSFICFACCSSDLCKVRICCRRILSAGGTHASHA